MKICNVKIRESRPCYVCHEKLLKGQRVLVFFPFRVGRSYACPNHKGEEIRNAINQNGDARWIQKFRAQTAQATFED